MPDVASEDVDLNVTSSPTFAVVGAVIAAVGFVRSSTRSSQGLRGQVRPAGRGALWSGPAGLSGIAASAAFTHAHTRAVGGRMLKSGVQVNEVDLPALAGIEQAAL